MTPPPPPGSPPPPPGAPGPSDWSGPGYTPIPPPPSSAAPPSVTWGHTKPPPPPCPVGAWLMIAGAVVIVIGCALPWFTILDETVTGFSDFGDEASDGYVFTVLAVIVGAFGVVTLVAKRLLPIAILAVVFASFAVIGVLADLGDLADLSDVFDISIGAGLPVALIGSLAALAGGIVALATRRR